MCQCKTEIQKRLHDHHLPQLPDGSADLKVLLNGYAIIFGDKGSMTKNVMPIEIEYQTPMKNGGTKKKKITQNMVGSYCMFCGEHYEKAEKLRLQSAAGPDLEQIK
ncbi:MAG: hypothetical protein JKY26_06555 [Pseudomonas sp.]|nr:hypothetical protein [Pseudomonas sp.]